MTEFFIFARFHARRGNEGAVAQALLDVVTPSREEPGCLSICVGPLIDHPLDVTRAQRIG